MATNPINPLLVDKSVDKFWAARQVLSQHIPHFADWNEYCSLPFYILVKAIRVITGNTDFEMRARMLAMGVSQGYWKEINQVTPLQLYKFGTWLKSKPGQKAIQSIYMERKILKKAGPNCSLEEAVHLRISVLQKELDSLIKAKQSAPNWKSTMFELKIERVGKRLQECIEFQSRKKA